MSLFRSLSFVSLLEALPVCASFQIYINNLVILLSSLPVSTSGFLILVSLVIAFRVHIVSWMSK